MNTPLTAIEARDMMPVDPVDTDMELAQMLSISYRTIRRRAPEGRTFTWLEPGSCILPNMIAKLQSLGYTCWTDEDGVRLFIGWGPKC